MNALYDCVEDGKVGIFESPTGQWWTLLLLNCELIYDRHGKHDRLIPSPPYTMESAQTWFCLSPECVGQSLIAQLSV